MGKVIVLVLCAVFVMVVFSDSLLAFDKKVLKDQELFTRTNLKVKGRVVFFHNMSELKKNIPFGTAVKIIGCGSKKIRFQVIESGKKYVVTDRPAVYSKYFVKNIQDIGMDGISAEAKANIENMIIVPGMTKKEVYTSKGCPAYIAHGEKSWGHTLDEIMARDTWYYNANTRRREMIVKFKDDKVSRMHERK